MICYGYFGISLVLDMSEYGFGLYIGRERVGPIVLHNWVRVNSASVWALRARRPLVTLRFHSGLFAVGVYVVCVASNFTVKQ